jgi:hypothetical protein
MVSTLCQWSLEESLHILLVLCSWCALLLYTQRFVCCDLMIGHDFSVLLYRLLPCWLLWHVGHIFDRVGFLDGLVDVVRVAKLFLLGFLTYWCCLNQALTYLV